MPTLTVDRFEVGLDRRKGQLASDANRLWEADNVYINNGRHIKKRPGFRHYGSFPGHPTTRALGLTAANGYLNAFIRGAGAPSVVSGLLREVSCNYAAVPIVTDVHFAKSYGGSIFVLLEIGGTDLVSCFDTTVPPNDILEEVVDANCPTVGTDQAYPCAIVLASKVFMGDDKAIKFTSTANGPSNWTLAADAGGINAAREALGGTDVKALGQYQGDLIAFFEDNAQAWIVDPDPAFISLKQSIDSVGCSFPKTVSNLASDCFFLSKQGFRSISLLSLTSNLADIDVGTAVDDLVVESLAVAASIGVDPIAEYNPAQGQYICAIGPYIYVYSFSRTAKISAWSRYSFHGVVIDFMATLNGVFYIRSAEHVWSLDPALYNDENTSGSTLSLTASFRTTMFDMKSPGVLKIIYGFDVVQVGTCDVRFHYQYIDSSGVTQTGATDWILALPENSRPGGMIPLDLAVTEIAMEARNSADAAWEFHAISLYYDLLGAV